MDNMYYSGNKGIKLFPTKMQYEYLDKCIIGYKIVYNWSLNLEYMQYDRYCNGETDKSFLSFIDLQNKYPEVLLQAEPHCYCRFRLFLP